MMAQVLVLAAAKLRPDEHSEDEFEAGNILILSEDEFARVVERCGQANQGRKPKEKKVSVDNEATDASEAA